MPKIISVTINTIGRVAASCSMFMILAVPTYASSQQSPLPDPLAAGWKGKSVCEQLYLDDTNRVLRCTFPPGVGHEPHYHVAHFGYALSGGKVRITDSRGTREVELETGSSYSSSGVTQHEILNIGTSTVTYLIVEKNQSIGDNQ